MPQMSPLNWLTLMFFFIMIILMINSLNYFSFYYPFNNSKYLKKLNIKPTWKW
uniref:ATP synthase complex subunit 8 n=1 Tax=Callosobruchus chinensis TaxID=146774 RepID=A0A1P8YZI8_CALCS|nr:ATP synthase F0 subunit 8 [Callosobruchus chinensis]AST14943.1 ATP synthase F0 subunit 8 [Callosobruchus chinensis]